MGYARAPATSANDSEQQSMSSDADTLSLTDSSVWVHTDLPGITTHIHYFIHSLLQDVNVLNNSNVPQ